MSTAYNQAAEGVNSQGGSKISLLAEHRISRNSCFAGFTGVMRAAILSEAGFDSHWSNIGFLAEHFYPPIGGTNVCFVAESIAIQF
jgi:hypothetical protein